MANAARAAINLRFENVELIERLRTETDKANAAHKAAEQAATLRSPSFWLQPATTCASPCMHRDCFWR